MATLIELRDERIKKLNQLRKLGYDPYPANSYRDTEIGKLLNNFEKLTKEEKGITIAGRVTALRRHGQLTFIDLKDATGKIQLFIRNYLRNERPF